MVELRRGYCHNRFRRSTTGSVSAGQRDALKGFLEI